MVIIVRDGWGRNPNPEHDEFNAVRLAATPRCDRLLRTYPWTLIRTSGEDVGLPPGTMGNSEVGHQNIGAGRIVDQESMRITRAIRDGSFFENAALTEAIDRAKNADHAVHLLGIASDAGVHGLLEHLYACLELCRRRGVEADRVRLHLFTDGRDTGPFSGLQFIRDIQSKIDEIGVGRIVSICGRYYAMDRDNRWERVRQAYELLTGRGDRAAIFPDAEQALEAYHENPTNDSQQGDEFVTPRAIGRDTKDVAATRIGVGDSVLFYNYRGDRPREITRAFVQPTFQGQVPPSPDSGEKGFDRGRRLELNYVCMTAYDQTFLEWPGLSVAFPKPPKMNHIAGQWFSDHGLTQFRCAETEKFPHVTFFFNDYREEPFPGEHREMAQSPKVPTYDLEPEMSAARVCELVRARIETGGDDLIVVNFANGDMVGHTGKLDAAVKAIETVDDCVGQIVDAALEKGGKLIITADHGNAEQMFDPVTGKAHTAHTCYDVECVLVAPELGKRASGDPTRPDGALRDDGRLADIVPTALDMMGLPKPEQMSGRSLIRTEG